MERKFINACCIALILAGMVACATHIRMQEFELDTQTTESVHSIAQ